MTTAIEICSQALVRLGAVPIQSFGDGSDVATACNIIYPQKVDFHLNAYPWRFSIHPGVQLSRLTEAPQAQWKYQFSLPPDRIQDGPVGVFLSNSPGELPFKRFAILGDRLFADEPEIWVKYQYKVGEESFPPYFTELMIGVMTVELCYLVTDNTGIRQELKLEVYGTPSQQGEGGLVRSARWADSRDTPTQVVDSDAFLAVRF